MSKIYGFNAYRREEGCWIKTPFISLDWERTKKEFDANIQVIREGYAEFGPKPVARLDESVTPESPSDQIPYSAKAFLQRDCKLVRKVYFPDEDESFGIVAIETND